MDYNNQNDVVNQTPMQFQAEVTVANPNNGMAIGSLICGIVGILMCCCCGIGAIVGIVGIILAICSKKSNGGKMSGMALAGLICSIVAIVFGAGYWIVDLMIASSAWYQELMAEIMGNMYY